MITAQQLRDFEGFDISAGVYKMITKVEDMFDTISFWMERSRNRKELTRLSDRLLDDIGLTRFDVEVETAKFFWQK